MSSKFASSRRDFIQRGAAASAVLLATHGLRAQEQPASSFAIPSRDTLLKFDARGNVRPFAGNTVICHLPVQCAMRDQMILLHDALAVSPFHEALGLTASASYHMTIFPGANDQDRSITGWPSYVAKDDSIAVCNQAVLERMASTRLRCELPIRVRVDQPNTLVYPTAATLRMSPADDKEERKLRSLRDQLAEVYGFRTKSHDAYAFHMTLSYQIQPFSPQQQSAYRRLLNEYVPRIAAAATELEFGIPEYCTFPDMQRFEPRLLLRCSS